MTPTDLAGLCERLRAYHNDCTPPRMDYALSDGLAFALTEAAAAIESLVADNERLREALKGLVERLLLIHDDPQYIAVWTIFQTHCGPYRGPQYVRELEAARAALEGASDA